MNKERATTSKPKPRGFRKALKIVGIILGSLVGLFVALMVIAVATDPGELAPAGAAQETVAARPATTERVTATPAATKEPEPPAEPEPARVAVSAVEPATRAEPAPAARAAQAAPAQPAARTVEAPETWRGIVLAPERRCSPYDSDDYRYSQSVELRIVAQLGDIIYGPYTGRYFASTGETDIEHIVARSEAHDSGLCAASPAARRQFASDLRNLTLAGPRVNRHQKRAHDAAEWLPDMNRCWYAARIVEVRRAYELTIDRREAAALEAVLQGCDSLDLVVRERGAVATPAPTAAAATTSDDDPLALYDDNNNGRITCAEARAHRIAPVRRGHPAYRYMNDRDDDGIVCE